MVLAGTVSAQSNVAEVYGGYAYVKANPQSFLPNNNMNGWVVSATGYPAWWFGVDLEVSAVFGDSAPPSSTGAAPFHTKEYSYLAGPQIRFLNKARIQSSGKILFGGVFGQMNPSSQLTAAGAQAAAVLGYGGFSQTKFAALFAVPIDVTIHKSIAWRAEPGLYLTGFNQTYQNNFRFSTGPVFRFGHRHE
jgi:hypothetical protein